MNVSLYYKFILYICESKRVCVCVCVCDTNFVNCDVCEGVHV